MTRSPGVRSRPAPVGHSNAITEIGQPSRNSIARIKLRCIPDAAKRRSTFKKRKIGLLKKASELSAMCDVQVCLFSTGHSHPELDDSTDVKFSWSVPETVTVDQILDRYEAMPPEQQAKKSLDYTSHLQSQIQKTEREFDNMRKANSGLEEEVYKKLEPHIQYIHSIKLQVDARFLELIGQQDGCGGMMSVGDQTVHHQPDLPAASDSYVEFSSANQVPLAQDFVPGGPPYAQSGMPQYGTREFEAEHAQSGLESSNEYEVYQGSENFNPAL